MKNLTLIILIIIPLLFSNSIMGQLNLAGGSVTIANLSDNTSELNTNFIGFNAFLEIPIETYSTRVEYSFYNPTSSDKDKLPSIDQMSIVHLYVGKVLRQGERFQVPLFIGGGKYNSKGDIEFDNWDIGAKIGARLYMTARLALFGDISAHYLLATDFTYINSIGIEETSDLSPITTHFNIGIAYSYLKAK